VSTLSGQAHIYTQITGQNILFPPWVYLVIAVGCFLVVNYLLFSRQEKVIKNYEAEEPSLKLIVIDSKISFRDTSLDWIYSDNRPWDGLNDFGMPMSLYLVANVEIENFGKDVGVFEWEISSIESGNIFILDPEETKGKFYKFSGEVGGRSRYTGEWVIRLQPSKPNIEEFAEILKNSQSYQITLSYWTKKIGGKSKSQSVLISDELGDFVNEITDKWEKRGLGFFARIALNKQ